MLHLHFATRPRCLTPRLLSDDEREDRLRVLVLDGSSAPRRPAAGGMLRRNPPIASLSA
jgi:hypothetical protein